MMKIKVIGKAHREEERNPYNFNQVHYNGPDRGVEGMAALMRVRLGDGAVVGDGSETGSTRGGNDSPGTSRPSRRMGGGLRSVTVLPWLELGGREADHIAARAEADLILAADLDIGVGEKGRVQIQR